MAIAAALDRALRAAGIPIDGVTVGSDLDRATWHAIYQAIATTEQRALGDTLIATFDPTAPAVVATEQDMSAQRDVEMNVALQAVMRVTWKYLPAGKPTLTAFAQEIKAAYKALLT